MEHLTKSPANVKSDQAPKEEAFVGSLLAEVPIKLL